MKQLVYSGFFGFVLLAFLFSAGGCSSVNTQVTVTTSETTATAATQTQQTALERNPMRKDKAIQWKEPALEALVRAKLEKPDGDIMQSELDDIWGIELIGSSHIYFNGKGGYNMYRNPDTYFIDGTALAERLRNSAGILFELGLEPEEEAETSLKEGTYWVKGQAYSRGTITSLSDFSNFRDVKFLNIFKNDLKDLNGLASLEDLTTLRLVENSIIDISALSALENIEVLDLTSNKITDASPLYTLETLNFLAITDNQINNIDGFSALVNLEFLRLGYNPIEALDGLASHTRLMSLRINNTQVHDVSILHSITSLAYLTMHHTPVHDISALHSIPSLTYLNVEHLDAEVIDLARLGTMVPNLTFLEASQDKAELLNVRAIAELKQLRFLKILDGIRSTNIPDTEIDWLREQLPGCAFWMR